MSEKILSQIISEVLNIRKQRKSKYGDSWKLLGLEGNFYMIKSKFIRLEILHFSKDKKYESEEDVLKDIVNYCLFQLAMIKEKKNDYKVI